MAKTTLKDFETSKAKKIGDVIDLEAGSLPPLEGDPVEDPEGEKSPGKPSYVLDKPIYITGVRGPFADEDSDYKKKGEPDPEYYVVQFIFGGDTPPRIMFVRHKVLNDKLGSLVDAGVLDEDGMIRPPIHTMIVEKEGRTFGYYDFVNPPQ